MIYDALVIGAGPAGSTAARLLASAGWSVALVEKSAFPRRKVCGEFISATSLPLLQEIDGFFTKAGPDIHRAALFARRAKVSASLPPVYGGSGAWGRALGREYLDTLLRDAAVKAGAALFQPCTLVSITHAGNIHSAQIESQNGLQELSSRIVIAANGSWERSVLSGPSPPHRPSDLLAFKAHFRNGNLPNDLMPLLMFPGGYGGMVHTDSGRMTLSCCIRRDRLDFIRQLAPRQGAGEAVLAHIRTHCEGVQDALRSAELDGAFLSAGPIRPGIRLTVENGIFRVGNAAGEAHPIIAEGISMAMQSARLLCTHLSRRRKDIIADAGMNEVALSYAQEWRGYFSPRLHISKALAQIAMQPVTAAIAASLTQRLPQLLTWGALASGKNLLVGARSGSTVHG